MVLGLLAAGGRVALATVTFTNTPMVVSNAYSGWLTLQIGGIPSGDTVLIQKYLDVNSNGVIDAGDWLVQQFTLTDGQVTTIGGITDINIPGDTDAVTGSITAQLSFQPPVFSGDIAQSLVGHYLLRLSSPAGHFAPLTNTFTVTNFPYAQSVSGTVYGNGTARPYAVVLAFQSTGAPQSGTMADGNGHYSLNLPVGSFQIAAVSSNYLHSLGQAPRFTVTNGFTVTTNLYLTNATQTISGQVADTNNQTLGLPGLLVVATEPTNHFIAVTFTDTNGNYTLGTRPSLWNLGANSSATALHGYLANNYKVNVNTSGGSASGVNLLLTRATAMFYGSVSDNLGNPLPGININSQDSTGLWSDSVATGPDGNYCAGAMAGSWSLGLNNNNPIYANYLFTTGTSTTVSSNSAVPLNFSGILGTNHVTGTVTKSSGGPIAGVGVSAISQSWPAYQTPTVNTDNNGNYSLLVANGNYWNVSLNSTNGGTNSLNNILGSNNYLVPGFQTTGISGSDTSDNFYVQLCSGITITSTNPLVSGLDGISYLNNLVALSCNSVTWTLTGGSLPPGLALQSNGTLSGAATNAGTFHFTAKVTDTANNTASQSFTITIQPPPTLAYTWASGQLSLIYPVADSSYLLQSTTNLALGPWGTATGYTLTFSGTNLIYTFTNSAPAQYFRLASPSIIGPIGIGGGGLGGGAGGRPSGIPK